MAKIRVEKIQGRWGISKISNVFCAYYALDFAQETSFNDKGTDYIVGIFDEIFL